MKSSPNITNLVLDMKLADNQKREPVSSLRLEPNTGSKSQRMANSGQLVRFRFFLSRNRVKNTKQTARFHFFSNQKRVMKSKQGE